MVFRVRLLLLILAALLIPRAASGGQPAGEPRYDRSTTVELSAVVTETREVPRGSVMNGLHVMVDTGKETVDVYLGPAEFMKQFDFHFARGDRIDVTGSKVKLAAGTAVLAREVRRRGETLCLRDSNGNPYW
jgi:hypothetical protein